MRRKISFFLAAVLLLNLFTACGGKTEEAPASYVLGDDQTVSLDSIMAEGAALLAGVESPTEAAIAAGEEEYVYRYRKSDDPAKLAEEYIHALRGGEQGFSMIDAENRRLAEDPNLETLTGSVTLAKKSATEPAEGESPKMFQVIVTWSEFDLSIRLAHEEGSVLPPPEKEKKDEPPKATAMMEQLEFFNSLEPRDIGLEGDNMADYMIYPKEGWVLVDSFSCRELTVYLEDVRDGTNVFMGTYYLSSDLQHLYQKTSSGSIVSIDLE